MWVYIIVVCTINWLIGQLFSTVIVITESKTIICALNYHAAQITDTVSFHLSTSHPDMVHHVHV